MNQIISTITEAPNRSMMRGPEFSAIERVMILRSGRSWWQVRYDSGKIVSEWKTMQGVMLHLPIAASQATSRWEEIPKKGIRGLYLLCPIGRVAVAALEANGDYEFFQFKDGGTVIGPSGGRFLDAHVIGKVDSDDGHCVCYAWHYKEKRLTRFTDNVNSMAFLNGRPLSLGHHTGIV